MWRYQKADYYTTLCNALGETEIEREEWQLIFISDLQPDHTVTVTVSDFEKSGPAYVFLKQIGLPAPVRFCASC